MSAKLTAAEALDRYYLETRCKIIEIAANLDRIERGAGDVSSDRRVAKIQQALKVVLDDSSSKAEQCQQVFSLSYEPDWPAPNAS